MTTALPHERLASTPPSQGAGAARALGTRRAAGSDLAAVNAVVAAALASWSVPPRVLRLATPLFLYTPQDLAHMQVDVLDVPTRGVCAVAAWERRSGHAVREDAALLHGLFVIPALQRHGVGSTLLAGVCDEAAAGGMRSVAVRAWREAEHFFLTRGFRPAGGAGSAEYPRELERILP